MVGIRGWGVVLGLVGGVMVCGVGRWFWGGVVVGGGGVGWWCGVMVWGPVHMAWRIFSKLFSMLSITSTAAWGIRVPGPKMQHTPLWKRNS